MPHADFADYADKKDECLSQITLISQINIYNNKMLILEELLHADYADSADFFTYNENIQHNLNLLYFYYLKIHSLIKKVRGSNL